MYILITGSSGFIGSALIREFSIGSQVFGIDISLPRSGSVPSHFANCDVLDLDRLISIFKEFKPEIVIHLAATHDISDVTLEKGGAASYVVNTIGTKNVLQACRVCDSVKRFIHTSSQMVSKPGHQCYHLSECDPHTHYGISKLESERYFSLSGTLPFEWVIVRPTSVWGPGMNFHYRRFLEYIIRGRYFHLSKRRLLKSYSYIENIAFQYRKLVLASSKSVHEKTFYLADYNPISLFDYANQLQKHLGAKPIPVWNEALCRILAKSGDVISNLGFPRFPFTSFRVNNILNEYVYDLSEVEAITGPLPVSFEEGVRRTADWYLADPRN